MIVYQTATDGTYIGPVIADENPLEPGQFLIPAGCVIAQPPVTDANSVAVWTGEAWIIAPAQTLAGNGGVEVGNPVSLAVWRNTASITRAEFIRSLRAHGILTFDDALNAAKGAWPTAFAGALSGLPEPMAEAAQLDWALATSIARQNPLFLAVLAFHAATCGLDAAAADALGDAIFGWIDPALPKTTPETGA